MWHTVPEVYPILLTLTLSDRCHFMGRQGVMSPSNPSSFAPWPLALGPSNSTVGLAKVYTDILKPTKKKSGLHMF